MCRSLGTQVQLAVLVLLSLAGPTLTFAAIAAPRGKPFFALRAIMAIFAETAVRVNLSIASGRGRPLPNGSKVRGALNRQRRPLVSARSAWTLLKPACLSRAGISARVRHVPGAFLKLAPRPNAPCAALL